SRQSETVMRFSQLPRTFLFATASILIGIVCSFSGPSRAAQQKDDPPAPAKELTYTAPKGWRAAEASPFIIAKFQVGPAEQAGTFTISSLTAPAGGLAANINRWRTQIGLESLEEAEVLKTTKEAKVDSLRGHLVDMTGP